MSLEKAVWSRMWFGELFQFGLYKRSQGRVTRQVTFAAIAITCLLMAWRLSATLLAWRLFNATFGGSARPWAYGFAGVLVIVGGWLSYRSVNIPRFADFLIAVEAEMNKVSWPSRQELIRSSMVVIFVIFALAIVLFGFDLLWGGLFEWMGILQKSSS